MYFPDLVREGRGITDLPRRFHFWQDIIPYSIWKLERKLNLGLHHGHKSSNMYITNEGKGRLRLDPSNSVNGSNNHG